MGSRDLLDEAVEALVCLKHSPHVSMIQVEFPSATVCAASIAVAVVVAVAVEPEEFVLYVNGVAFQLERSSAEVPQSHYI